jgi:hypothetical protein
MLRSAIPVLKEVLRQFPEGGIDLETITKIVVGVTKIDRVHFTEYNVPSDNPIIGEFRRFEQRDAVYSPVLTVVEIRYANHLTQEDRQFVVCKELCHSLEEPDGRHAVTDNGIDDLVAAFSIMRGYEQPLNIPAAFGVEILAMTTAIEILLPNHSSKKNLRSARLITGKSPGSAGFRCRMFNWHASHHISCPARFFCGVTASRYDLAIRPSGLISDNPTFRARHPRARTSAQPCGRANDRRS